MPSFSSESEECVAPVQAKINVEEDDDSDESELYIPVKLSKNSKDEESSDFGENNSRMQWKA